jgi:hypothetical protein
MTTPPPSPEKRALIDAFDTVMKADAERRDADPRPDRGKRTRPFAWALLAVAGLAVLGVILLQPEWIGLGNQLHEPPAMQDASLRFALVMEAQRVARYERTHHALPNRLEDAGPVMPGVTYRRAGAAGYELTGANGEVTLTYRSSDAPSTFLGHSLNVLSRRGK